MVPFLLAGLVEVPVFIEITAGVQGAQTQHGFGSFEHPLGTCHPQTIFYQVPACPLDGPCSDGEHLGTVTIIRKNFSRLPSNHFRFQNGKKGGPVSLAECYLRNNQHIIDLVKWITDRFKRFSGRRKIAAPTVYSQNYCMSIYMLQQLSVNASMAISLVK